MKRIIRRTLSAFLVLCLFAALACPALAADHALNEENNWVSLDGQLIMPGDTVSTVVYKDISEIDNRITVMFKGASLSMEDSFNFDTSRLKDGHTLDDLSGFTPVKTETVDVIALAADDVPELNGIVVDEASWTTSFTNTSEFPIVIKEFTSGSTTQHYSGVIGDKTIYVSSYELSRPMFTAYEPYYLLDYRDMDMTEEELAELPDRYYISNEKNTITLPVLQTAGAVFCGYYGVPGEGVISEDGKTITYTYDWEWLKAAETSGSYSFEDHTVSPEFGSGHTIHFCTDGGLLDTDYLEVGMSDAADFDLYSYIPVREGYTFIGWSEEDDDPGYLISSDYELPLYSSDEAFCAIWVENEKLASWGVESALQALSSLGYYSDRYDADGDRNVTTYDAALFLQLAVGQIDRLPAYTSKTA